MNLEIPSSSSSLLLVSILINLTIFQNLPSFCTIEEDRFRYSNCLSPFQCPNSSLNLTYPFWGSTRPSYCGHPLFELNCINEAPIITITSTRYRVIDVNYTSHALRLAAADYWTDICPTHPSNSTLSKSSFFNYSDDTEFLRFFYGCPKLSSSNSTKVSRRLSGLLQFSSEPKYSNNPGSCIPYSASVCSERPGSDLPDRGNTYTTPSVKQRSGNEFECLNRNLRNYYSLPNDLLNSSMSNHGEQVGLCDTSVAVPIVRTAAETIGMNSSKQNLVAAVRAGFGVEWKLNESLCKDCETSGGVCGSDPSTGGFTCYCPNGTYLSVCEILPTPGVHDDALFPTHKRRWIKIAIGCTISSFVVMILVAIFLVNYYKKKRLLNKQVEDIIRLYAKQTPKRYTYSEVKKMTNSFKYRLGEGGFSIVYKGKLPNGRDVAVKLLNSSKGDGKEFINEVASISTTCHVNIVSLLGFCFEWNKRALIYEFMPNGSLDKYICQGGSSNNEHQLDWRTLYNIVIGIARGLDYLHCGCNTRILHFDIKPHNILLSEDLDPKISDFGLAKQCKAKESYVSITGTRGTPGFIAPEVFNPNFGRVSHKSDVYSFGMLILAMIGKRKNRNDLLQGVGESSEEFFPDWIYEDLKQDGSTNGFWEAMTEEEEELARKMIIVSLCCIQTIPTKRPSMSEVVEMLGRSLDGLQIPPRPSLLSPPRSPQTSSG